MTGPREEELLDTYQTAMLIGVNRDTLERWRRLGGGPAWIKVSGEVGRPSGAVRYRRSDVEAYLAARTIKPAKDWRNS